MGKITGFLEFPRELPAYAPVAERLTNFREFTLDLSEAKLREQGARCMDCGIPFCHHGCPLHNLIPEWNDLVYRGRWKEAVARLHATNNLPEVTGRICPAPCEASCVINLEHAPVTIRNIEKVIAERGFSEGWIEPRPAPVQSGKRVAVVGSGPAGLAAAQELARAGHTAVLFEKADRIGGLLRYGIPDFKLEKPLLDRRIAQLVAEGVELRTNINVGVDLPADRLVSEFDAVLLAGGAGQPRDLEVPGRDLKGIHFALDYLIQQNRVVAGDSIPEAERIDARGKRVVVIGGGDTGSDCVGTANRQGALAVHQFELLPQPPQEPEPGTWPNWPMVLRTSTSHAEGCAREWSIATKRLTGRAGRVTHLHGVRLAWSDPDAHGRRQMVEIADSEFTLETELVLLAMGFLRPVHTGLIETLGMKLDARGNVQVNDQYQTSIPTVFAAGDMHRGASLVVWAIAEGRQAAAAIDRVLRG
ncbi:MAG: glutamate synthase [Nitrospirae bacterium CG18_big_fil_WC_8_21_14_2_50_70_55]|nr:glutamate synthase subunit beta [Deltaproteobacteria bacterium]OIP64848.1 MAG: glutamate synthase [Nitrospirae bacterium CG2_30_70_394]PIQ06735.1 MAG: glutamate synthase [Nitrospirae bacterium CG18_big_fil_WC_8_21_14_2_50_70_55]PIU79201.1 MAG: glutamate synthase [Nitrospirae bacterium CG06_land_8_20_14_3_00_70_43]PIW83542.1 MAG: glutamate synthase [Nitrospirae bacterium CG_4_8_14_3_um_filter_70_85]PIX84092.1 MAG: glutamate synthase [Nitrospirae bacterium CG_4_10_14_3_um_filter_70_108]PJB96